MKLNHETLPGAGAAGLSIPSLDANSTAGAPREKLMDANDLPDLETFFTHARLNNLEGVHDYLANGGEVNVEDKLGYTALIVAAREGHLKIVHELVARGADLEAKTNGSGLTALIMAAASGYQDVTEFLVEKGAELEVETFGSVYTALDAAVMSGFYGIAKFLRESGAR